MKVLIVDGNEKSASDRYTELGMLTQYEVYKKVLAVSYTHLRAHET